MIKFLLLIILIELNSFSSGLLGKKSYKKKLPKKTKVRIREGRNICKIKLWLIEFSVLARTN